MVGPKNQGEVRTLARTLTNTMPNQKDSGSERERERERVLIVLARVAVRRQCVCRHGGSGHRQVCVQRSVERLVAVRRLSGRHVLAVYVLRGHELCAGDRAQLQVQELRTARWRRRSPGASHRRAGDTGPERDRDRDGYRGGDQRPRSVARGAITAPTHGTRSKSRSMDRVVYVMIAARRTEDG